ncbi:hypothetical protein AB0F91_46130 [Amycolatopsis sp. NPDC023774]|uniref:hypothetical protein n=1 Tax=Amycolatopsis sp. NPDC023774 TaxID=3155015 RepID=UPI0033D7B8ED
MVLAPVDEQFVGAQVLRHLRDHELRHFGGELFGDRLGVGGGALGSAGADAAAELQAFRPLGNDLLAQQNSTLAAHTKALDEHADALDAHVRQRDDHADALSRYRGGR